ncbi:MAG: hypothetical protein IH991_01270 [Planctomycetes bacterium]|nr:hypothetical protein [Planctomycetota bacterium]
MPTDVPTVGGFLYVTLASLAAGLTVSTVRWAVVDSIHHRTGIRKPNWDYSNLEQNIGAYDVLVEHKYRYYQAYSNMLVSLVALLFARRYAAGFWTSPFGGFDVGVVVLVLIFFAGSRDTLTKYYARGNMLLGEKFRESDVDFAASIDSEDRGCRMTEVEKLTDPKEGKTATGGKSRLHN